jgi:protein involved in polysaccharide export with SLBB domain
MELSKSRGIAGRIKMSDAPGPAEAKPRGRGRRLSACLSLSLCLVILPLVARAEPYRLGPQDHVRVKVVEYRAGRGETFEWTALNSDYAVNPEGAVSIPVLGDVPAAGKTTAEFGEAVSDALQKRAGLENRPAVSVEVITFRPVYILGDVQTPGEFAYRPGLTVLQAVSLSGGFYRLPDTGLLRLGRDQINASGDLTSARLDLRRAFARKARLEAELSGASTIAVPPELQNDKDAERLIADETAVMKARSDALQSQLTSLAGLKNLYTQEGQELVSRIANQQEQIDLTQRDLNNIGSLLQKGLAVNQRQLTLEKEVSDLKGQMLDLQTASVRAKQEVAKAERDSLDLQKAFKSNAEADLQGTRALIDQLAVKLKMNNALIAETQSSAAQLASERSTEPTRTFYISRKAGDKVVETQVDPNAPVQPGDVIRVKSVMPDTGGDLSALLGQTNRQVEN